MRIALDAMGAERGAGIVIEGAAAAIRENPQVRVLLVGEERRIKKELAKLSVKESLFTLVPASQIVTMDDTPAETLKEKRDSSIAVAAELVRQGSAEAMVSCGNTGVVMATALVKLRKLEGIRRPCLAVSLPTLSNERVILTDVGANVDCRPAHLLQFALMGSLYAHSLLGKKSPRVGLLNIGTEAGKGGEVLAQTFRLLQQSPLNFVGNVEGNDIISGKIDVVVCDGFVGNTILKFAETFAITTLNIIKQEIRESFSELGDFFPRKWLAGVRKNLDYSEYGGIPLLGIDGICIIAHGASTSKAVKNAILIGYKFARSKINQSIKSALRKNQEVVEQ